MKNCNQIYVCKHVANGKVGSCQKRITAKGLGDIVHFQLGVPRTVIQPGCIIIPVRAIVPEKISLQTFWL